MGSHFGDLGHAINYSIVQLKSYGGDVDAGKWQGIATEGKPDLITKEILNLDFEAPLERAVMSAGTEAWAQQLAEETGCNAEWANEHFFERVDGVPLNPDPSYIRWPWWRGQTIALTASGEDGPAKFSHTYSERFWPKQAGYPQSGEGRVDQPHIGIRYPYGDYNDVLNMLEEDPYTRQAYLPIFFPEDTGAVHGGRIPCSLGYHFILRGNKLHCWYEIRSCDAVRHFRDDLYLAARLVGHTIEQLFERELRTSRRQVWVDVVPGTLYFKAHSFHVHMGDYHLL